MYTRKIDGRVLTFAFHPSLFRRNLLLYDVETKSLWSQLKLEAVRGPLKKTALQTVTSLQTTWKHWRTLHPETLVVRIDGKKSAPYRYRPPTPTLFGDQTQSKSANPSRQPKPHQPRPLDLMLGVTVDGVTKAYPFHELAEATLPLQDRVGEQSVTVHFDREAPAAWATDEQGRLLPSVTLNRRGWIAFHRKSMVYHANSLGTNRYSDGAQER